MTDCISPWTMQLCDSEPISFELSDKYQSKCTQRRLLVCQCYNCFGSKYKRFKRITKSLLEHQIPVPIHTKKEKFSQCQNVQKVFIITFTTVFAVFQFPLNLHWLIDWYLRKASNHMPSLEMLMIMQLIEETLKCFTLLQWPILAIFCLIHSADVRDILIKTYFRKSQCHCGCCGYYCQHVGI